MTFQSLLPANATQEELAQEMVHSHVGDVLFDIRDVKNPDKCPVDVLPWLAWEFGVTWWDESWSEEQKRNNIKSAAAVNKTRGTLGAVKQSLASVGYNINIIEWFNDTPQADPYTFRVEVIGNSISGETLDKIYSQILDTKNCRSWLSSIDIGPNEIAGACYVGGAIVATMTSEIGTST